MPIEGSMRAEIRLGCPSLDRKSRQAEVGFEPRTFRSLIPALTTEPSRPYLDCFVDSAASLMRTQTLQRGSTNFKRRKADLREDVLLTCLISSIHRYTVRGCPWAGIVSGCPHVDSGTIRVLRQCLWLERLIERQRSSRTTPTELQFSQNKSPHVRAPNLEDQDTVYVRPLTTDQPGMRDSVNVTRTRLSG
ncbi:hypothetical protein CSKR_101233 [Clonorchis sinensis]|uniref:Uncharacterized protein n=1 Tax=Clonorchis sinensis TaxID=79923 RepID=A0A419PC02_CLOSI|nr:hypothetical protein CSKR_101233 [Clonorchis sinensis]